MTDIEEKDKERIKALEKQVQLHRRTLRHYRDQLNDANDIGNVLCNVIDTFTYRHPEHAAEIKELIDYWESTPEEDDEECI